jgi:hypothetical protein
MKQNAEIFATQDYYEFVCFDLNYAQLGGIAAFGLSALSLRFSRTRNAACGPEGLASGCNKRATRGATAHYRHDRDRVSVTVCAVLRCNTMIGLVTESVTAVG